MDITIYREKRLELKRTGKDGEWSQTAVARKCGVSLSSYALWEKGVSTPNPENLVILKKVLGLD